MDINTITINDKNTRNECFFVEFDGGIRISDEMIFIEFMKKMRDKDPHYLEYYVDVSKSVDILNHIDKLHTIYTALPNISSLKSLAKPETSLLQIKVDNAELFDNIDMREAYDTAYAIALKKISSYDFCKSIYVHVNSLKYSDEYCTDIILPILTELFEEHSHKVKVVRSNSVYESIKSDDIPEHITTYFIYNIDKCVQLMQTLPIEYTRTSFFMVPRSQFNHTDVDGELHLKHYDVITDIESKKECFLATIKLF